MRELRRQDRKLTTEEAEAILQAGEYGVLATVTEDGKPYCVPMSYAYDREEKALYMHCSAEGGQKIDNLRGCPEACFTVVSETELMPEKFGTRYWSANVTGKVTIIADGPEKRKGIEAVLKKYSPEHLERGMKYIDGAIDRICILKLAVGELTGKARKA